MSNIDWSMLITKQMKEDSVKAAELVLAISREDAWRTSELPFAADQLMAIDDDDPNRLPGTDREWRDYRIALRAWKEGNINFPEEALRPIRPTGD